MNQELAITDNVYVSVPKPDAAIEDILRSVNSGAYRDQGALRVFNLPSAADRTALIARRKYLVDSLSFDQDKVALLVTRMLQGYMERSKESDPKRLAQDVALFMRELKLEPKIPTWAVALACNAIRLGNAPGISLVHRPSTMALRSLCDSFIWKTRAEIANISAALTAVKAPRPISPEERAEVGAKFTALVDELKARSAELDSADSGLSIEQLKEMAGGDYGWDRIPDRESYRLPGQIGSIAEALGRKGPTGSEDGHGSENGNLDAE